MIAVADASPLCYLVLIGEIDLVQHAKRNGAQGRPAFIAASAVFLTVQSVQRLMAPQPIEHSLQALIVMFVAAPPLVRALYRLRGTRAAGVEGLTGRGLAS